MIFSQIIFQYWQYKPDEYVIYILVYIMIEYNYSNNNGPIIEFK